MSLLLAFLPVEGLSLPLPDDGGCARCDCARESCCFKPDDNPVPTREALPAPIQGSLVERFVEKSSAAIPVLCTALLPRRVFREWPLQYASAVPLSTLYCAFLI